MDLRFDVEHLGHHWSMVPDLGQLEGSPERRRGSHCLRGMQGFDSLRLAGVYLSLGIRIRQHLPDLPTTSTSCEG